MTSHTGNKRLLWQHLTTMVIDKIRKISIKGVKLKSESFFSISPGVLELWRKNLRGGRFHPPGPDRVKRWVTKDVLPTIRKTGRYDYCIDHKYNNMLTFKIESETDLHIKVIHFLKKRYPHSLFTVTLGENQDTVYKRIDSFKKGYLRGSPDLIINNLHKRYTGFCIEMKTPKGNGVLSPDQSTMLRQYQNNGFKTLVSNDYDHIIEQIIEYFRDVRILCLYCLRRFIGSQSLENHIKSFHKMA